MMQRSKKGVLLVNLGTPDSPAVPDVRKYLDQFLMDGRVIDIPYWRRALLVKGIITTFRSPKSAKLYQEIWRENGSPLLHYSVIQQRLLQEQLGDGYVVELAMRYQSPSIADALERLRNARVQSLQVIPLFPQYASASSGSVVELIMRLMQSWHTFPKLSIAGSFYDNEQMVAAFAANGQKHGPENFDHVLFSYHGLPVRQLVEVDPDGHHDCEQAGCRAAIHERNQFCYVAQCYATTRLIAAKLGLQPGSYTVCFQSRLGKTPWVQPYTSDVLKTLADQGKKKLLTFCPAFVADCLETLYEVSVEYHELFRSFGGERVQLVESLNDHPLWIAALKDMVLETGTKVELIGKD